MQIVVCSHVPCLPEVGTPYHLTVALGEHAEVFYITPVVSWNQRRARLHTAVGQPVQVITPILPRAGRSIPRRWRRPLLTYWSVRTALRELRNRLQLPIVLWAHFSETALALKTHLQPTLFCYHRLDDFTDMNPRQATLEQRLMQQADLNFVVAPSLIDTQWMRPNSWVYLPNGVLTERFAEAQAEHTPIPADLASLPAPRIGYIGAVHPDWVDVERLFELAQAAPEWSWVVIDPKICWSPPAQCPKNFYFLGARPYAQLPAYLKGLDVCIIPFRRNAIAQGASPLKLYEYLAAGKAVISVPYFHDLQQFGALVYTAETVHDWLGALRAALAEAHHPTQIARRMQSVAPHSWQARAVVVMQTLRHTLETMHSGSSAD